MGHSTKLFVKNPEKIDCVCLQRQVYNKMRDDKRRQQWRWNKALREREKRSRQIIEKQFKRKPQKWKEWKIKMNRTKRDTWISSSIWYTFRSNVAVCVYMFFFLCYSSFSVAIVRFSHFTSPRIAATLYLPLLLPHAIFTLSIRLFCWIFKLFAGMPFNMFLVLSLRLLLLPYSIFYAAVTLISIAVEESFSMRSP